MELVAGAALGAILGLVLTLFLQPYLESPAQRLLVRIFGSTAGGGKRSLAGMWSAKWWEDDGTPMPDAADDSIQIKQFGKQIAATFHSGTEVYRMLGRLDGSYVTGTWTDLKKGMDYHGAFQLFVLPGGNSMAGKWVGFGRSNVIKSGVWEWKRTNGP